jgi:uncharacterized SAM-binding protein YcdF (DUF218 family)
MRLKRGLVATVAGGFAAWLLGALWIDRVGTVAEAPRPACAIVVLGARVEAGGTPSPTLAARIEAGVSIAQQRGELLLFSGGVGTNPPAEADVGAARALSAGVKAERILAERESHSTWENAAKSAPLLEAAGVRCVHLVTDPYHLARARWAFERHGFDVTRGPVFDAPRHRSWTERVLWTMREVPALIRLVLLQAVRTRTDNRE